MTLPDLTEQGRFCQSCSVSMILARKIVALSKAQLDGRSVAFGIPYRCYVGTHNENHAFIEQKRVFDSLGEDLGVQVAKDG